MSRILIVEDDRAIGVALEDDLRLEGHVIELVSDGEAAVRRAREIDFDLLVLDLMLPERRMASTCAES
jgi:DNA-binding response OmpR family regulator